MNISGAKSLTLTDLSNELNNAGLKDGTELRAKSGGEVLYAKSKSPGFFTSKETRVRKQTEAREVISQALKNEVKDKPGASMYEAAVRKNLRHIFEGTGAITKGDVDMVTRELADLRGSYALYGEGKKVLANDTAFKEGSKNASAILKTIPEYRADMNYFDAAKLFISINSGPKPLSDDTKAKLGALSAHMTNEGCEVSDLSDLSHASEAVLTAAEHGATSVVALPQGVALRQMAEPTAWGGRCMPLVSLAALAESRGPHGTEGVMHRLEQETHDMRKTGRRDQSAYAQNLSTLHTLTKGVRSPITDASGKPTVNLGHRNTVSHLATQFGSDRTKPVMYAVHVTNHVMMIGASSHNGKDSFTFYDPNFGTAKFASKEDLSRFLDDYFMKLEMGDSYGMKPKGGPDHHFTNVEQFDLGGLAALSIRGQKLETMAATR